MKTALLSLALFLTSTLAQTGDDPRSSSQRVKDVCAAKQQEYGARFIQCEKGFDSGLDAQSASYQPTMVGPLTTSPGEIDRLMYSGKPTYVNRHPEVKGMSTAISGIYEYGSSESAPAAKPAEKSGPVDECLALATNPIPAAAAEVGGVRRERGYPLGFRMVDLIEKRFGKDSELHKWFKEKWLARFTPGKTTDALNEADGSCHIWSRWAVDKKVIKSLENITNGVMCDDFPFNKGEIKEIYYQLYGAQSAMVNSDSITRERTPAFFDGDKKQTNFFGSSVQQAMDANLGLAKLGVLGAGSEQGFGSAAGLNPMEVYSKFKAAALSTAGGTGKGVSLDRDHGAQIWNQPVVAMVVTLYRGDDEVPMDLLSTTDFEAVDGDGALAQLKSIEKDFIISLASGEGMQDADRARFKALTGIEVSGKASRSEQAELFAGAKKRLAEQGKIRPKGSGKLRVVNRDLTVIYGNESEFASMAPNRVGTRSYRFATVEDAAGNVVKTAWNPSQGKLSDICGGHTREKEFVGFSGWSAAYECCKLEKGRVTDYPVFTSAVPPRHLDIFDSKPYFSTENEFNAYKQFQVMLMGEAAFDTEREKQDAIRKFGPLKAACPSFDRAAQFGQAFRRCVKAGAITADDRKTLLDLFDQAQFLDDVWIQKKFCPTTGVTGFDELKQELNMRKPGFCS